MGKTIYAVNHGSYSDYRIVALFSSEKLAKEYMQTVPDLDYNDIETYEIDPPAADLIKRGYSLWNIHMLRDGNTERVERVNTERYYVEDAGRQKIWERSKAPAYKGKGIPDILISIVWAKTEKQAIKIVNEQRAQMIVMNKF